MKIRRWNLMTGAVCAAFLASAPCLVPAAKADEWDKKTYITFSAPVEIPGMVLPAGEYVFKLLDSTSNRNIVQILNARESHLYATVLAIPDYRMNPSDKTVITFEERASGAPEAIHAWFYPGEQFGQEFVYPKARAMEIAERTNQPVLAMPSEMATNISKPATSAEEPGVAEMKQAPVETVTPDRQKTQVAQAAPAPAAEATPAPAPAPALPEALPRTASDMPLVALTGLVSLGAALGVRRFSKGAA
jgi:hypothetical protein